MANMFGKSPHEAEVTTATRRLPQWLLFRGLHHSGIPCLREAEAMTATCRFPQWLQLEGLHHSGRLIMAIKLDMPQHEAEVMIVTRRLPP